VPTKLDLHAEQLSALGHPARLAIVRFIVQGGPDGTAAGEIQTHVDLPASTLSHHLKRLASAGLIRSRNEGTFIYYSPNFEALKQLTAYIWEDCCERGKGCC
jgi:DNA-binding transcriptional ArsR family regulator